MTVVPWSSTDPMTDSEVVRFIRESMPLDVGVTSMPDSTNEHGQMLLNVMVVRSRGLKLISQMNIWMDRAGGPITRARCSSLIERYLDHHHS